MNVTSIFSYAALLLSLLYFTKELFLTFFLKTEKKNKNLPPSLTSLPIVGHLHLLKKPLHLSLSHLSAQHGPILYLRFGNRPVVLISSAALAKECFTTNDVAFANRPRLPSMSLVSYNYTTLGSACYGPIWREMRRIITVEALSSHRLELFAQIRAEETRDLVRMLLRDASSGDFTRVELRQRLFGLATNVIMRMVFGKRYYGEEEGDEEARRFREVVEIFFSIVGVSNFADFLPAAVGWFARRSVLRKFRQFKEHTDKFFQSLVDECRRKAASPMAAAAAADEEESDTHNRTLIQTLLLMQKDQPEQYTDHFIKAIVSNLLTAGTDTTSKTIEWAISLLLNNPDKLLIARSEIDEKVGKDRLLKEYDLINLSYLHCIINETLRLYPVAPLLIPHESMEECEVGGYTIPSKTMILANVYSIHRDPENWLNPIEFIPERFLDGNANLGNLLPFGMGRRRCPGEGLAMRQFGLVLGTLIQCFEWKRIGNQEVDLKEGSGSTMPKANSLEALYMPRRILTDAFSTLNK